MPQIKLAPLATACQVVLLAALLAGAADADAKGRRSSGGSSSKPTSSSKADSDKDGPGFAPTIVIRRSSSPSASPTAIPFVPDGMVPIAPAAAAEPDPEELARRAARAAALERIQLEKAAAARAAFEKAEAERIAAEHATAERAARRAAEERVEAGKVAAALEKKRREDAAVAADVDRVLQRAMSDHPVLKTAEGAPLLQAILERQKVLQARGAYPSIAMVEAVADHSHLLAPRPKAEARPVVQASAVEEDTAKAFGGCRWVTPSRWACSK